MPVTPTYPGIYIQEAPSSSHTITPAPTSVAVFIGYTHPLKTNPANFGVPVEIFGFLDYQRQFGGFVRSAAFANAAGVFGDIAVAVNQFFLNGGSDAFVVALNNSNLPQTGATVSFGGLSFVAREITDETYQMTVTIRPIAAPVSPPSDELADVIITYGPASGGGGITETYRRVSMNPVQDDGVARESEFHRDHDRHGGQSGLVAGHRLGGLAAGAVSHQRAVADLPRLASGCVSIDDLRGVGLHRRAPGRTRCSTSCRCSTHGDARRHRTGWCSARRSRSASGSWRSSSWTRRSRIPPTAPPPAFRIASRTTVERSRRCRAARTRALYFPYLRSPDPITGAATNAVTGQP